MPWWGYAFRLTGLGWYIALCVVGGTFAGLLLDRWIGTSPLFTLLGVLLGVAMAFYGVYRLIEPLFGASNSGQRRDSKRND
jgi:F0F1-type ATP synthase assembly protein I